MIGEKLSERYEIVSELGRGGMGVVYRARDPLLNREVAVKVIAPELLTPETEQRFQTEAQVVAQMDHPSIVTIHDFGRHEGSLFFVMPIVEGESLRHFMREKGLTLGTVLDVAIAAAEALDYSHSRGVIHRDIKPENLMVSLEEAGRVRLRIMDFGLARGTNVSSLTKTGMLVGTMSYISPEQVMGGEEVDGRSDLYSLGCVLYECLVHEVPFAGEMQSVLYRIVHEIPQSPRALGADIDEELEAIVLSCLTKEREKRPQSAGDLARSLARYRSKLGDSQQMRSIMVTRTMQAPRSVRSPFVGREKEFQELQQHLNQAVLGECQFAVISGEPGVGKSRLVDELETLAAARQIRVLHGRFVEQRGSFPYHGFCEVIQEYFRQKESGSSASGLPDFSDLAGDLVSLFPMLSEIEVIRSSAGGSSQFNRTGEERLPENRTQIFELLARTLTLLAVGKPLILVLEDLHGAEASIEALEYIVRRLGPTPTLIVGTYRSTEVDRAHPLNRMLEGFEGDRRFSTIKLEAMAPAEHREFLTTLTGGTEIVDALATRLFEVTEGNPFFTKELVRSLLDAGSIAQDKTGTWALAGGMDISSDALPATIQQAVEKRIERLPDELRSILSIASVMGKTFDLDDLEALAGGETDLDDAAERFIHEGLLEEERQSRGDQLSFTSAVVREVLYSQLSRRKRRSLHRKYATQLEKRHTGRLERIYPQLVYHFAEGDVPEKTVEYGLQHARKALGTFSHDDAVRSARTALEFLEEEWEGDPSLEGEARLLLAEGLLMAGNTSGALKEIEVATKVFEELGKNERAARSLLMAAKTAWQARQVEETRRWVERGLEVSRQADDSEILRQFLSLAATLANLRGEYDKGAAYLQEAEKLESGPEQRVAAEEIPEGGRLVVGIANPVSATTPVEMQFIEEFEVFSNVVETLLTTDAQGNLIPNLCEKWETQENGASFLFTLRPDVRFQDGDPLTAEDVKKAFESSIPQSVHELAPGLAAIRGARELAGGKTDRLEGLEVLSDTTFTINLEEPLPIYPALLTDIRTGITRAAGAGNGGPFLGTGPFRLVSQSEERLILERNAQYWKGAPPRLESLEFRPGLSAAELAAGLRSGEVDLARDLLPKDLEELLRDARFRKGLVEAAQKFTYFVLFNVNSGPAAGSVEFRRALSGVVRSHDLVWQTLGRFALPAAGFLPPGILGHDPGRRARLLSQDEARQLVREAGHEGGLELQAAVHPLMQDRYLPLLEALFAAWEPLGVTVAVATPDMKSFIEAEHANEGIDLCITRWGPDYDDPDNFTHGLFHTSAGLFSAYFSSSEADKLMETGRAEIRPEVRESVYRQFESKLLESATLIPLFYDVDARVASPKVRGIRLGSTPPHVNYSEVGKVETAVASEVPATVSGTLRVPMTARLQSLDPSLAGSDEQAEVLPNIFETLTRDNGKGQIEPWLAREIEVEEEGRRYRFHLRSDVRFHDGRRLTARDVRYSLERLLCNPESDPRWLYSAISGGKRLLDGEGLDLAGIHIRSAHEFTIELEKPMSFFLGLLAYVPAAIVPEGTENFAGSWQQGTVGTGPFRVVSFDPQSRLELEANPFYWREGLPRSEGLEFSFALPATEILSGFRSGQFCVASDLFPADIKALRQEPSFASGFLEAPRLNTYFLLFNGHDGPMANPELRRRLVSAIDREAMVGQTLRQVALAAKGWIPPGLLGSEPARGSGIAASGRPMEETLAGQLELSVAAHPIFFREYSGFFERLEKALATVGVKLKRVTKTMSEFVDVLKNGNADLGLGRWIADYPDPDAFAHVLHGTEGLYGRMCGTSELDRLIDSGRTESDPKTRHGIYRRFEELIQREALLLPLFHEQVYRFTRPELDGATISYWAPAIPYENLSLSAR